MATADEALEGARHIVAEMISENADFRKALRQMMFDEGVVTSRKVDDAVDEQEKFKMYYDYREPASKIPSHRMLAIRRGESENILYFLIELEPAPRRRPGSRATSSASPATGPRTSNSPSTTAWKRLLNPSIQTEIRLELKKRADAEAIRVFRDNLENLLLAPPAGQLGVLGIDPGIRTGCKIAVVDETGKFLEHSVIYPHAAEERLSPAPPASSKTLIAKHNVQAIAIGNGTASRETDAFVRDFLKAEHARLTSSASRSTNPAPPSTPPPTSPAQEFPDLDLTVRGAISIARRLQDPLAELVKIDPKSIGVGQYQHDVDQRHLQAVPRSRHRKLRQPRRRRPQHRLLGAAPLRRRHQRAHGAEDRRVPQRATAASAPASSSTPFPASAPRPSSRRPASSASAAATTRST